MSLRLNGQVAIITGGGAGIGRAACCLFAQQGAQVVCADLSETAGQETVRLVRNAGGQAIFTQVDVAVPEHVATLVRTTSEQYGRLDTFWANAGIVPSGRIEDFDLARWQRCMQVNVASVALAFKYSIPIMKGQKSGVLIATASVAGLRAGIDNRSDYSMSKAGVGGLVLATAREVIRDGITVNAICPGTLDTPSLRQRVAEMARNEDITVEQALQRMIDRQPMGRLGTAEEIAEVGLFLATYVCPYMTGQWITADGGLSL